MLLIRKIKSALSVGVLVQLATLALHIFITPNMTIVDRADFAMVNAVTITLVFLLSFGFQNSLIRKFALHCISKDYLKKTFLFSLFHLGVCISVSTLILKYYGLEQEYFLLVYAVIFLLVAKMYLQSAFLGLGKNFQFQISKILPVITLLFFVVMVSLKNLISLKALLCFWVASEFMGVLFLVSSIHLLKNDLDLLKAEDHFYEDFIFGAKAMLGQNSFIEGYKFDQIILGFYASHASLALYAVAKSVCSSLRFISQSLSQILLPILLKEQSDFARLKILSKFVLVGSACSIFASVGMLVVAHLYLVDIVGPEYGEAVNLLLIMAISFVIFVPRRLIYEYLKSTNRPLATSAYEFCTLFIFILIFSALALSQITTSIYLVVIYSGCLANIIMLFVSGVSILRNFREMLCR